MTGKRMNLNKVTITDSEVYLDGFRIGHFGIAADSVEVDYQFGAEGMAAVTFTVFADKVEILTPSEEVRSEITTVSPEFGEYRESRLTRYPTPPLGVDGGYQDEPARPDTGDSDGAGHAEGGIAVGGQKGGSITVQSPEVYLPVAESAANARARQAFLKAMQRRARG